MSGCITLKESKHTCALSHKRTSHYRRDEDVDPLTQITVQREVAEWLYVFFK